MAYHNTGYARNTVLTVTKGDNPPLNFNITGSFTDPSNASEYEALTTQAFQRLTEEEYQIRLQAFIRHVYAEVEGLQTDCPDLTLGSVDYNPLMCPLSIEADASETTGQ